MLEKLHPDVCSVATSGVENGSDHYEPVLQAFDAGCHVLCEKPMTFNVAEARELKKIVKKN